MIFRLIKYQFLAYLLIGASVAAVFAPVETESPPALKSGDVVFQTSLHKPALAFILLSRSLYDNVGIFVNHNGRRYVLQAGEAVDFIPYDDWIAQGAGGRFSIWRHEKMVESDITPMVLAVKPYFRKPYDMLLQEGNELLYSSELVHLLYKSAQLSVGLPQSIRDLVGSSLLTRSLAEQLQPVYPGCEKKTAEECEEVLLGQKVITPKSLTQSPGMKQIYSNYLGGLL